MATMERDDLVNTIWFLSSDGLLSHSSHDLQGPIRGPSGRQEVRVLVDVEGTVNRQNLCKNRSKTNRKKMAQNIRKN